MNEKIEEMYGTQKVKVFSVWKYSNMTYLVACFINLKYAVEFIMSQANARRVKLNDFFSIVID